MLENRDLGLILAYDVIIDTNTKWLQSYSKFMFISGLAINIKDVLHVANTIYKYLVSSYVYSVG